MQIGKSVDLNKEVQEQARKLDEKPFVSYRPVVPIKVSKVPKLYSIVYTDGTNFLAFLIQRTSRIRAQNFAKKHVKHYSGYDIHGVNLVDKNRLASGHIVQII